MRLRLRGVELALLLGLAACATTRPEPRAGLPQTARGGVPGVKIGKPYQVFGIWYYPADDRSYDQRGIASWYGPGFNALSTANGERYDQDDVTAAHKTLPMPSWVEVENLDNGRKLTVRINDRGPFVAGRIIDLSRRSAQLLGVDRVGLARVRVRRVFPDGAVIARAAPPPVPVTPPAPIIEPVRTVDVPGAIPPARRIFVQVAALSDPGRIAWLGGYLASFGAVVTEKTPSGLTRLRLGPYADATAADAVLAQLRSAGYSEARLVETAAQP